MVSVSKLIAVVLAMIEIGLLVILAVVALRHYAGNASVTKPVIDGKVLQPRSSDLGTRWLPPSI